MEENEEASSNLNKSPVFDKGDSLLDTEELKITDECGSVPKLDEFVSVVEDLKDKKEDEGLIALNEMENLVIEVEDSGVGGGDEEVKSLGMEGTEKEEAAGEEEEIETSAMGGGGNFVTELNESQLGGVEALSEVKDSGHGVDDANEMDVKADSKVDANEMELKADSKVELEAEAICGAGAGAEVEWVAKLEPESDKKDKSDKDDDVGMEEKPEMELMRGDDKDDDVGMEERQEMELVTGDDGRRETISELSGVEVGNESQNAAEEKVGRENLKLSADIDNVAEDTVLEEENLVMEVVTETKVDEPKTVPELSDEEDEMETENEVEEAKVDGGEPVPQLDDLQLPVAEDEDEEDETMVEEEIPTADTEMETETDAAESVKVSGGKRKRGRNSKVLAKAPGQKTTILVEEEDVCFICFDGGDLVLCDRK